MEINVSSGRLMANGNDTVRTVIIRDMHANRIAMSALAPTLRKGGNIDMRREMVALVAFYDLLQIQIRGFGAGSHLR
jgi:hypothetical protein